MQLYQEEFPCNFTDDEQTKTKIFYTVIIIILPEENNTHKL